MTLGFSTKWPDRMGELAGQPNYFIYYIWMSLPEFPYDHIQPIPKNLRGLRGINRPIEYHYDHLYRKKFKQTWDDPSCDAVWDEGKTKTTSWREMPKRHSLRHDPSNRWKPGMDIHFVVNNRTKDRFQFAPVVKCVNVQEIEIHWFESNEPINFNYGGLYNYKDCIYAEVTVDDRPLMVTEMQSLATNDGFDSVEDFFAYFNKDFKGKIIHWTDLRY